MSALSIGLRLFLELVGHPVTHKVLRAAVRSATAEFYRSFFGNSRSHPGAIKHIH